MQYKIMALVGFLIWLAGTIHGGFSDTPQSVFEHMTDFVGVILMIWGIMGDILNGLTIHKDTKIEKMVVERVVKRKEIVICAAVKAEGGEIIRGHRHADCYAAMKRIGLEPLKLADGEGFITSRNRFVDRNEGQTLQKSAGIPSADREGYDPDGRLFSEDLY